MTDNDIPPLVKKFAAHLQTIHEAGLKAIQGGTWPAALAAHLETAARHLWASPTNGQALYNVAEVLEAVDAARSRGEIPPRKEVRDE